MREKWATRERERETFIRRKRRERREEKEGSEMSE